MAAPSGRREPAAYTTPDEARWTRPLHRDLTLASPGVDIEKSIDPRLVVIVIVVVVGRAEFVVAATAASSLPRQLNDSAAHAARARTTACYPRRSRHRNRTSLTATIRRLHFSCNTVVFDLFRCILLHSVLRSGGRFRHISAEASPWLSGPMHNLNGSVAVHPVMSG